MRSLILAALMSAPAPDAPSIDSLIEKLSAIQKQRAELDKAEKDARVELWRRWDEYRKRLEELGLTPPAPLPPEPKPPEPKPDAVLEKLKAALAADSAAKADVLQLAAIYREAAKVAGDPEVATSAVLLERVRKVSASLIGADALPAVRGVAAGELLAALGMSGDDPLTAAQRQKAAAVFTRLAAALEDLSK